MNNHTSDNSVVTPATTPSAPVAATGMPVTAATKAEAAEPPPATSLETPPPVAPTLPPPSRGLPDHTVRLGYELVLWGGRHEILHVKSELNLPLALDLENLAQTDLAFPELVDQVIVRPMVARFRNFLQMRYDMAATVAQRQKAAAEAPASEGATPPPDPLASLGLTLPPQANSDSFDLPEASETKFPVPKMPEFPMRMVAKNGR